MNEWKEYKLGEIGKVVTGKTPSTKVNTFYGGPVPFICIPDLGLEKRVKNSVKKLTLEGVDAVRNMLLPKDAIMVSCIATIGKVGITKIPSVTNQQINSILVDNTKALPDYIYYWFKNEGEKIGVYGGGGSVFNIISKSKFENIPVSIPDLSTQTAIAEILSSLDDKIELNNQINKDLEALAQALFKQWFIDFDFPNENGEPYRSSSGEMMDSEFGEIPKGWNIYSMSDLLETVSKTYQLKNVDEVIFLNTGDIHDGKFLHENISDPTTLPGQAKKSIVKGDILYSEIRPANKRFAYVHFDSEKYVVSTKLMVLRSKVLVNSLFQYFILTQQDNIDYLQHLAESRSGTFPQITFSELSTIRLALPDIKKINEFVDIALIPYFNCKFNSEMENRELSNLRDVLLPKLISGELKVTNNSIEV